MLESKTPEQPKSYKEKLQERAEELRNQIKRQEEFAEKFYTSPDKENVLMKKQQDLAHEKNKKELEKIKKELKFKFGIELSE